MRKRPISILFYSLLISYFPLEYLYQIETYQKQFTFFEFILLVVLPSILIFGLVQIQKIGWYTLIGLLVLFGFKDWWESSNSADGTRIYRWFNHLFIYVISLAYFINPRVRRLYFDPKSQWWNTKKRTDTHLPILTQNSKQKFIYPILKNLSEGGCFIETKELFAIGQKIKLTIPFPIAMPTPCLKLHGEIRWRSTNPFRTGVGIQFLSLNKIHKKNIRMFLKNEIL